MNHDMKHEERQNAALRLLCQAVASVAAHSGAQFAVKEAHAAAAMLDVADEAPGPEAAAVAVDEPDAPDATPVVSWADVPANEPKADA